MVEAASKRLRHSLVISGIPKATVAAQQPISISLLYAWTNPANERFPDPFQLDTLCRTLDTECEYVLTGEYGSLIRRHLSGLNRDGVASAKGMVAAYAKTILMLPGPRPPIVTYAEKVDLRAAIEYSRRRLKIAIESFSGGIKIVSEKTDEPVRKIRRWLSVRKPEGFPDCFVLMDICRILGIGFGDIIRNRSESQDFEIYLSTLARSEIIVAKKLAAAMFASVYRL